MLRISTGTTPSLWTNLCMGALYTNYELRLLSFYELTNYE